MLGITLVIISLLIVVAVLYGHQKRETFTNMRGAFPKWIDVINQVKVILDAQFEYDAMKFSEFIDKQTEFTSITGDEINQFMLTPSSKYLPSGFKLNIDVPFDSKMAMYYANRGSYVAEMKKPTDMSKLILAYKNYYTNNATSETFKSNAINFVLDTCTSLEIIKSLKEKTTFSLL